MEEKSEERNQAEEVKEKSEIWKEVKGVAETEAEREEQATKEVLFWLGLKRCPECGGEARVSIFGRDLEGVWVGCEATPYCAKYIEYRKEGWSIAEVVREWNKYNSGVYKVLRRIKRWFSIRYGADARYLKRRKKERKAKARKEEAVRALVYGVESSKKRKNWVIGCLKGIMVWAKSLRKKTKRERT